MPIKVKMLKMAPGSPDGIRVVRYEKDSIYDLPDHLARVFIEQEWAEVVAKRADPAAEKKMQVAAPENKMEGGAENGKEGVQSAGKEADGKEEVAAKPRQATRSK